MSDELSHCHAQSISRVGAQALGGGGVGMKTEAPSEFQDGDKGMLRHVEDSSLIFLSVD